MSRGRRELSADEKKLWRKVASAVKPRRGRVLEADADPPHPPPTRATTRKVEAATPPKRAATTPPLADRGAEKRVRRGKLEIGGTLDLHGYHQDSGRNAVIRFLQAAHARGDRTVIVVTGVGRGGQGILKQRLPDWLAEREVRGFVAGFAQAHRAHGGAGAYYVFLKRREAR